MAWTRALTQSTPNSPGAAIPRGAVIVNGRVVRRIGVHPEMQGVAVRVADIEIKKRFVELTFSLVALRAISKEPPERAPVYIVDLSCQ